MDDIIINSKEVAQTYHIPRIGDDAPAFIAQSTQGPVRFPQDFAGKGSFFSAILPTLPRYARPSS
jgi:hypothetical protein